MKREEKKRVQQLAFGFTQKPERAMIYKTEISQSLSNGGRYVLHCDDVHPGSDPAPGYQREIFDCSIYDRDGRLVDGYAMDIYSSAHGIAAKIRNRMLTAFNPGYKDDWENIDWNSYIGRRLSCRISPVGSQGIITDAKSL